MRARERASPNFQRREDLQCSQSSREAIVHVPTTDDVLALALEAGFDLAGIAPLAPPRRAAEFEAWLDADRHAGMGWLERQRNRIVDPRRILPGARSVLVVGLGHGRGPVELSGGGRVARYAAGRDYHNVIGKRLRKLARRLEQAGFAGPSRAIVDAGPLLERSHAAEAGIGFESKAANLLHVRHGPWFFLGELLLEGELEPTSTPALGSCGTCRACLDACPTGALLEPGVLDANLCLSYHTIENRGAIPPSVRERMESWAFGCDVCSEVCPWGTHAPDRSASFGTHAEVGESSLIDWLTTRRADFDERFEGSPLRRPGRDALARNAAFAMAKHPSDRGRLALLQAMDEDPSPLVREAAFWTLAQSFGSDARVRERLDLALARETDPASREGMRSTLDD